MAFQKHFEMNTLILKLQVLNPILDHIGLQGRLSELNMSGLLITQYYFI